MDGRYLSGRWRARAGSITVSSMTRAPAPALLEDLYQLTMAQAYLAEGLADRRSVFELSFRRAPHGGTYALAAGIGPALDFIEGLRYGPEEIDYLRSLGFLRDDLLGRLAAFRFPGDVDAVPEGTVVFPGEPVLRVTAPILEAQLLETPLLNLIGFPTLVATKAARVCLAAGAAEVIEFGCRRAQGPDGALTATRAAFIGGASSTSNLEAGRLFGIPVKGTMAHSYVMAHPSEMEAFRAFARSLPGLAIVLIDTDDSLSSGLPHAIALARELRGQGGRLLGVRLDSGDLAAISRQVRAAFDAAGFPDVKVYASGDLDEERIEALVSAGAPIDSYGVGTRLAASEGDPALTCIYKLSAVEEAPGRLEPRMKRTDDPGKGTLPGAKSVRRLLDAAGLSTGDVLGLEDEEGPVPLPAPAVRSASLLAPAFRAGRRTAPLEDLRAVRDRARSSLESIPLPHRRLRDPRPYPVAISPALEALRERLASAGPPG